MAKNKRNQRIEQRKKLFRQILKSMGSIIRKYGKEDVRLAVNYWNRIELEKKGLVNTIENAKEQLEEIEKI